MPQPLTLGGPSTHKAAPCTRPRPGHAQGLLKPNFSARALPVYQFIALDLDFTWA